MCGFWRKPRGQAEEKLIVVVARDSTVEKKSKNRYCLRNSGVPGESLKVAMKQSLVTKV
jgi:hypothetical protein